MTSKPNACADSKSMALQCLPVSTMARTTEFSSWTHATYCFGPQANRPSSFVACVVANFGMGLGGAMSAMCDAAYTGGAGVSDNSHSSLSNVPLYSYMSRARPRLSKPSFSNAVRTYSWLVAITPVSYS